MLLKFHVIRIVRFWTALDTGNEGHEGYEKHESEESRRRGNASYESHEESDEGYGHCESHVLSKMHSATQ